MNLVTSYFLVRRLEGAIQLGSALSASEASIRQREYLDCLWRNTRHPQVEAVHLLVEGMDAYQHLMRELEQVQKWTENQRLKVLPFLRLAPGAPTYSDLFGHASQLLPGKLAMVCNADVYLSPSAEPESGMLRLWELVQRTKKGARGEVALALTRYEKEPTASLPLSVTAPLISEYRGSHDAFVLEPPLPPSFLQRVHHRQNCYQAENIVIYELQQCGYTVLNPCHSVHLLHQHEADIRQWFPPVDSSRYGRAAPCTLQEAKALVTELHLKNDNPAL